MAGSPTIASLFTHRLVVGVGDMAVSNNAQVVLSTYALGSCIGLVAYDPAVKAGGMLHFMLPNSAISPEKATRQPAMFADTGLPAFFRLLVGLKAEMSRLRILVAGGACVLAGDDTFKIGERNTQATLDYLAKHRLTVLRQETGGTVNRTIHLEMATGKLVLKTPAQSSQLSMAA